MKNKFSFSSKPVITVPRNEFDLSNKYLASFNMGKLVPVQVTEVLPGDTFKFNTQFVIRTSSPFLKPIMDNLTVDLFSFFVPSRLLLDTWPRIFGEHTDGPWANQKTYEVPKMKFSSNLSPTSLASYFGLPLAEATGDDLSRNGISPLLFRAYALIWNEWYRDENLMSPKNINFSDSLGSFDSALSVGAVVNDWMENVNDYTNVGLAPVCKKFDYFTACLPSPQKGDAVSIFLPYAPVYRDSDVAKNLDYPIVDDTTKMMFGTSYNSAITFGTNQTIGFDNASSFPSWKLASGVTTSTGGSGLVIPQMVADLSSSPIANVNDLRFAFQLQKMLEKDARGGTRYTEFLSEHFGIYTPDSVLQRPQFLYGSSEPLRIYQQTSSTGASDTSNNLLGEVSAYSVTAGSHRWSKGFTEYGYVMTLACVRQNHTYSQGIDKMFTRFARTDFYQPVFSNIGEQPIYTEELFADENSKNNVFGYNEAWIQYRSKKNIAVGVKTDGFINLWTLADYYKTKPVLNDSFIMETPNYLDRVLTNPSTSLPQFVGDFYNSCKAIRELPLYSIPGLIDHH